jgi:glycosyltransferase involved in cell wall biosynthesis
MAAIAEPILGRRCEVIPRGVSPATFFPASKIGSDLLYVADFYPHKRHELLIEAWTKLRPPRPALRLIGDPSADPATFRRIRRMAEKVTSHGSVVVEGPLTQDEVADAYRRARVVALPSNAESFCLPLAEAQACGVPVVASDIPALRETGNEAATYVSSSSAEQWAHSLTSLLENDHLHQRAREAGLANAKRFSWETSARTVRDRLLGAPTAEPNHPD